MKLRTRLNTESGKIYFCSDLHYGHKNILKINYHTRGKFSSIEEMNEWIESEVWEKLKPGDSLFDLGDTFWKQENKNLEKIFSRIRPGVKLYKTIGNHDSYGLYYGDQAKLKDKYEIISDLLDIQVEHEGEIYMISLSHYPMVSWNHKPYGSFMLHGHCHGNVDDFNNSSPDLRVDVGLDGKLCQLIGKPIIEFEDILNYFKQKVGELDFSDYVKQKNYNL